MAKMISLKLDDDIVEKLEKEIVRQLEEEHLNLETTKLVNMIIRKYFSELEG